MKKSELRQIIREEISKVSNEPSYEDFQNSDEMGWMEVTMEEVANDKDLDLDYRNEFNKAFVIALSILKKEHPELNFPMILKFREKMF